MSNSHKYNRQHVSESGCTQDACEQRLVEETEQRAQGSEP